MDKQARRAALAAYKERKVMVALFALRCAATGEAWVGGSRDMAASRNRHLFALKLGSHGNPAVRAVARAHGAEAFSFEPLEEYEQEDEPAYLQAKRLQARVEHWRGVLAAAAL